MKAEDCTAEVQTGEPGQDEATDGRRKLAMISVRKAFGSRPVLRDLSMEVSQGEIVGLFGGDGAGKTVCFYTMLGLVKPEAKSTSRNISPVPSTGEEITP